MKLLLQILWGWSVLANGAVGIQVGTVQTNNQNIKLMKFNYNNPAWLQAAGNAGKNFDQLMFTVDTLGDSSFWLSGDGLIKIKYQEGGNYKTIELESPDFEEIDINMDQGSNVTITGLVTAFSNLVRGGGVLIRNIDLTSCASLESLTIHSTLLDSALDLSKNTKLKKLSLDSYKFDTLDLSVNTLLNSFSVNNAQNLSLLSLENCPLLGDLTLSSVPQMASLDIRYNEQITSISLSNLDRLTSITAFVGNETFANSLAEQFAYLNESGVIFINRDGEYNQIVESAALARSWSVQFFD